MSAPQYSSEAYEIRPAKSNAETDTLWSKSMLQLGWDRFGDDLSTYMDHSTGRGMLLAFEKGSDQPIGHIAAVCNDNGTGWASLFIVEETYRGVGLGAALFSDMLAELSTLKHAGLDAVPEQKATYERRGFVESKLGGIGLNSRAFNLPAPQSESPSSLVDIHKIPAKLLAEYEDKCTGFLRVAMWQNLLNRPDVVGFVKASKHVESVEEIEAVGLIRRCPGGSRLGPLYADSANSAEAILTELIAASTPAYVKKFPYKQAVALDGLSEDEVAKKAMLNAEAWTGNAAAAGLFAKLGFTHNGLFHRMWLSGNATPQQSAGGAAETRVFAIFDGAIG